MVNRPHALILSQKPIVTEVREVELKIKRTYQVKFDCNSTKLTEVWSMRPPVAVYALPPRQAMCAHLTS